MYELCFKVTNKNNKQERSQETLNIWNEYDVLQNIQNCAIRRNHKCFNKNVSLGSLMDNQIKLLKVNYDDLYITLIF